MKFVDEYRDAAAARGLADAIARTVTRPWTLMEVCGGQTHTIVKYGIDGLLPPGVELVQLTQEREHPAGLGLVDPRQGEPDVDQDVFPRPHARDVVEAHPPEHPAEIDLPHEHVVLAVGVGHLAGDAETHPHTPFRE